MIGWNEGVTNAISYIEENLDKELDIKDIADKAYVSAFYFQKIFHVLCEFTVGEYIRNRRLSLAGTELAASDAKVMDVALKYGYESPDSFAKAFQKFHGMLPSQARNKQSQVLLPSCTKIFIGRRYSYELQNCRKKRDDLDGI